MSKGWKVQTYRQTLALEMHSFFFSPLITYLLAQVPTWSFVSSLRVDLQAPLCDLVVGSTDREYPWADHIADFLWPLPEVLNDPVKLGPGLVSQCGLTPVVTLDSLTVTHLCLLISYWSLKDNFRNELEITESCFHKSTKFACKIFF